MLQRGEARVTVRIEDRTVSVTHRGETRGCSYQKMEQAWCVYEANVAGACADGFVEQSTLCSPSNPGVLEDFEHPDKNELYSAEWHEGLVHALAIDANDPVALEDGTRAYLHRGSPGSRTSTSIAAERALQSRSSQGSTLWLLGWNGCICDGSSRISRTPGGSEVSTGHAG
jgi:hypothetical protein